MREDQLKKSKFSSTSSSLSSPLPTSPPSLSSTLPNSSSTTYLISTLSLPKNSSKPLTLQTSASTSSFFNNSNSSSTSKAGRGIREAKLLRNKDKKKVSPTFIENNQILLPNNNSIDSTLTNHSTSSISLTSNDNYHKNKSSTNFSLDLLKNSIHFLNLYDTPLTYYHHNFFIKNVLKSNFSLPFDKNLLTLIISLPNLKQFNLGNILYNFNTYIISYNDDNLVQLLLKKLNKRKKNETSLIRNHESNNESNVENKIIDDDEILKEFSLSYCLKIIEVLSKNNYDANIITNELNLYIFNNKKFKNLSNVEKYYLFINYIRRKFFLLYLLKNFNELYEKDEKVNRKVFQYPQEHFHNNNGIPKLPSISSSSTTNPISSSSLSTVFGFPFQTFNSNSFGSSISTLLMDNSVSISSLLPSITATSSKDNDNLKSNLLYLRKVSSNLATEMPNSLKNSSYLYGLINIFNVLIKNYNRRFKNYFLKWKKNSFDLKNLIIIKNYLKNYSVIKILRVLKWNYYKVLSKKFYILINNNIKSKFNLYIKSCKKIQRLYRKYRQRCLIKLELQIKSINIIKKYIKNYLFNKNLNIIIKKKIFLKSVLLIQKNVKIFIYKNKKLKNNIYAKQLKSKKIILNCYYNYKLKKILYNNITNKNLLMKIIKIQSVIRSYLAYKSFLELKKIKKIQKSILLINKIVSNYLVRKRYLYNKLLIKSRNKIKDLLINNILKKKLKFLLNFKKKYIRMNHVINKYNLFHSFAKYKEQIRLIIYYSEKLKLIKKHLRIYYNKKKLSKMKNNVLKLKNYLIKLYHCYKLNKFINMKVERKKFLLEYTELKNSSIILIQKNYRRFIIRKKFLIQLQYIRLLIEKFHNQNNIDEDFPLSLSPSSTSKVSLNNDRILSYLQSDDFNKKNKNFYNFNYKFLLLERKYQINNVKHNFFSFLNYPSYYKYKENYNVMLNFYYQHYVVIIQKSIRRYLCKKMVYKLRIEKASKIINSYVNYYYFYLKRLKKEQKLILNQHLLMKKSIRLVQKCYLKWKFNIEKRRSKSIVLIHNFLKFVKLSNRIKEWMIKFRKRLALKLKQKYAATLIQSLVRCYLAKNNYKKSYRQLQRERAIRLRQKRLAAALKIQCCYRIYLSKKKVLKQKLYLKKKYEDKVKDEKLNKVVDILYEDYDRENKIIQIQSNIRRKLVDMNNPLNELHSISSPTSSSTQVKKDPLVILLNNFASRTLPQATNNPTILNNHNSKVLKKILKIQALFRGCSTRVWYKKNYFSLLKKKKLRNYCIECEKNIAIKKCYNCNDKFCNECYEIIHQKGTRRNHQWFLITSLYDKDKEKEKEMEKDIKRSASKDIKQNNKANKSNSKNNNFNLTNNNSKVNSTTTSTGTWVEYYDPSAKAKYWFNHATNEASWIKPT